MGDKEKIRKLEKDLAICRKTVTLLSKEKQILMDELFTMDPNNEMLTSMQQ